MHREQFNQGHELVQEQIIAIAATLINDVATLHLKNDDWNIRSIGSWYKIQNVPIYAADFN